MIKPLLILAFLTVVDPMTGPVGAGDLLPPTAAVYRNLAAFDLQELTVADAPGVKIELRLGSFSNPYGLQLGFSHPVIDVYVGGGDYGLAELLPGPGMRLPEGELWSVAFRLTGDAARGYQVLSDGSVQEFVPAVELVADRLLVSTDLPAIRSPRVAAMVGLYDPFQETGWRPLAAQPNAWAFSSSEQVFPVLDVLAIDETAQKAALLSGILPVTEASSLSDPKTLWLMLMASGMAIAGAGILLRTRTGRHPSAAAVGDHAHTEAPVEASTDTASEQPEQTRGASQTEIAEARERLLAEEAGTAVLTVDAGPAQASDSVAVSDERLSFEIDWEPDTWLDEEAADDLADPSDSVDSTDQDNPDNQGAEPDTTA